MGEGRGEERRDERPGSARFGSASRGVGDRLHSLLEEKSTHKEKDDLEEENCKGRAAETNDAAGGRGERTMIEREACSKPSRVAAARRKGVPTDRDFRKRVRASVPCDPEELRYHVGPGGVDAKDPRGRTALMHAIQLDNHSSEGAGASALRRVRALLDMKADVNARERLTAATALTRAVQSSDEDVVKLLLDAKASVQEVIDNASYLQDYVHKKDTGEWLQHVYGSVPSSSDANTDEKESVLHKDRRRRRRLSPIRTPFNFALDDEHSRHWHSHVLASQWQGMANYISQKLFEASELALKWNVISDLVSDDVDWVACCKEFPNLMKLFTGYAFTKACESALTKLENEIRGSGLGAFASPTPILFEIFRDHIRKEDGVLRKLRWGPAEAFGPDTRPFNSRFLATASSRIEPLALGCFLKPTPEQPSEVFKGIWRINCTPATLGKTSRLFIRTGGGEHFVAVLKDGIMKQTRQDKEAFLSLVPFWKHMKDSIKREQCMGSILTKNLTSAISTLNTKIEESQKNNSSIDAMWFLNIYYTIATLINLGADLPLDNRLGETLPDRLKLFEPCRSWFEMKMKHIMCEKSAGLDDSSSKIISEFLFGFAPCEDCLDPRVLQTAYTAMLIRSKIKFLPGENPCTEENHRRIRVRFNQMEQSTLFHSRRGEFEDLLFEHFRPMRGEIDYPRRARGRVCFGIGSLNKLDNMISSSR